MKKLGFTLAEVLITLGIVGTIAAITLPTLMSDTTSAQIGPKLAKAVSMFEQANEALLNANSVDSLTDAGYLTANASSAYASELSKYLKITKVGDTTTYRTKDGMSYTFVLPVGNIDETAPPHRQKIFSMLIDIDSSRDIALGTDTFWFNICNDGSLFPFGATEFDGTKSENHWTKKCPKAEDGVVTGYMYCAGHIFENNLKVLYR